MLQLHQSLGIIRCAYTCVIHDTSRHHSPVNEAPTWVSYYLESHTDVLILYIYKTTDYRHSWTTSIFNAAIERVVMDRTDEKSSQKIKYTPKILRERERVQYPGFPHSHLMQYWRSDTRLGYSRADGMLHFPCSMTEHVGKMVLQAKCTFVQ